MLALLLKHHLNLNTLCFQVASNGGPHIHTDVQIHSESVIHPEHCDTSCDEPSQYSLGLPGSVPLNPGNPVNPATPDNPFNHANPDPKSVLSPVTQEPKRVSVNMVNLDPDNEVSPETQGPKIIAVSMVNQDSVLSLDTQAPRRVPVNMIHHDPVNIINPNPPDPNTPVIYCSDNLHNPVNYGPECKPVNAVTLDRTNTPLVNQFQYNNKVTLKLDGVIEKKYTTTEYLIRYKNTLNLISSRFNLISTVCIPFYGSL